MGVTVLSASTTDEEAIDGYKQHGLFTYVLAQGLSGEADLAKQGVVSNMNLATYVAATVPSLAENLYKHAQQPVPAISGLPFSISEVLK
jgi:uncharacterized caspase-like protein